MPARDRGHDPCGAVTTVRAVSACRYQVVGSHPAEDAARWAGEVWTVSVAGPPVEALLDVVRREDADLPVVHTTG